MTGMARPMLNGYKVLDITQFVAGPTCGRILAEMGAEVIKIELAPFGDRSRVQGLQGRNRPSEASPHSTYFAQHNHSKKCLALDWKQEEARELIREMVRTSDVLIENFTPGVMQRAALAYEDLRRINPALVMCSISFAGQTGTLAAKPGYDYIGQAYAGITGLVGEADGVPMMIPMTIGDVSTGVSAAMAVGFALLHRERTGEGQHVETSLVDTYFHMHESSVPRVSLRGDDYTPTRTGSQHPDGGPTGVFRCGDGRFITLMSLAHQWPQLVEVLGMPELLDDPRFASARARRDNNALLQEIIEGWLAARGSREACLEALEAGRIPCAPVLTVNEALAHPHLRQRGTVRELQDETIGTFAVPGTPARFSGWEASQILTAGRLGEHNAEVLRNFGYDDAQIAALYESGTIVRDRSLADEPRTTSVDRRDPAHASARR